MSKRWFSCLFIALLCLLTYTSVFALTGQTVIGTNASDGYIVKFASGTSKTSQSHSLTAAGLRAVESFSLVKGLTFVKVIAGQSTGNVVNSLSIDPNIEFYEPNYLVTIDAVPNDSDFTLQYGLNNSGQTAGTPDVDIDAPEAWDITTGGDVIVAVIDTGADVTHPDLRGNIWINPGEIPGNGIDDDNNGYIDDVNGFDFSNNDGNPSDDHGHGTHVSGIIAAKGNNGLGVSGVNWNAKIMPLKFIDSTGIGSTVNAIRAINYAVAMGARISNNSWGGGGFSQSLFETISAAANAGHLFVAAAGNDGLNTDDPANTPHYPSSYDLNNIISVAATDHNDSIASFSNFGALSVDIGAPGVRIYSLLPGGLYQSLDGTSMAAPFVTGVAALLLSRSPNISTEMLRNAILNGIDPVASLSGITTTGGRLNALKALRNVTTDIKISPNRTVVPLYSSQQFTASGGTPPYSWSLTNTGVGNISTGSGLFNATNVGTTQITVMDANGFNATSGSISVDTISIKPGTVDLRINESFQFTAVGGTPPYSWSLSNGLIGVIDRFSGVMTASAIGQTDVVVTDSNNLRATAGPVRVFDIAPLVLTPMTGNIAPGTTLSFSVTGGIAPYQWEVSHPLLASINSQGVLTAISDGTLTVTAKDSTGAVIHSGAINISGLLISTVTDVLNVNETTALTVEGGTPPYQWRVSNSSIANVDSAGVLTAITPGSVKVTIMDANGLIGKSATLLVTETSVMSLFVSKELMAVGDTQTLRISGGIPPYTWRVGNNSVLSVDSTSAILRALGAGVTDITVSDSTGATVRSPLIEVRELKITPLITSLNVGDTLVLSASGGVAPYQWRVSSSSAARIDNLGQLVAMAPGVFFITLTDSGGMTYKSSSISVVPQGGNGTHILEIRPATALLSRRSNNVLQFIVTGGLAPYSYSSSNSTLGNLNSRTGEFVPLSDITGVTTIVASDADGHIVESGEIRIQ